MSQRHQQAFADQALQGLQGERRQLRRQLSVQSNHFAVATYAYRFKLAFLVVWSGRERAEDVSVCACGNSSLQYNHGTVCEIGGVVTLLACSWAYGAPYAHERRGLDPRAPVQHRTVDSTTLHRKSTRCGWYGTVTGHSHEYDRDCC
eukprot:COSAG06_NODE_6793_length_2779_cov_1.800000_2_plen_147_part_00